MRRRTYLAAVTTAFLAGCTGDEPGQQAESTPADSETDPPSTSSPSSGGSETAPTTEAVEPASFELVAVDAPERVEIGEEAAYSFTVQNTGGQSGEFETAVSTRVGGSGAWDASDSPWAAEIAPGETVTLESQSFSWDFMERVDIRIDAFDQVFTIQFVSKTLAFGEAYTNPNTVVIQVAEPDFRDSYSWSSGSFDYEETPTSGNVWAFVEVFARNDSGQVQWLPLQSDFGIIVGNQQYEYEIIYSDENIYEGGEVQPGIERSGWIVFEVPDDVDMDELNVVYSERFFEGDVGAYWSVSGE